MPITFEDPPHNRPGPRSTITNQDRATLIEHTGEWAVIWTGSVNRCYQLARQIRTSHDEWAGHTWEAVTRRNPDRTAKVYARHITPTEH